MRNKFSELVKAGVAAFHHEPIAPETPLLCPMCKLYNAYWGAATDSHMTVTQDGRKLITGRITQDPCKWGELIFSTNWGGINWCQSGYCTLGEFFQFCGVKPNVTIHNGEQGIELLPLEDVPAQFGVPQNVTTTESKIPQPIRVMGDVSAIQEAFENAHNTKQLVENLNNSKWIAGNKWFVYEDKAACAYETPNGMITYIMEVSSTKGKVIDDKTFNELLAEEGLGDIKLVQYDKYFKLESDDRKWSALLDKWKDNKITEKSFDVMSPADWVAHIKWMISALN